MRKIKTIIICLAVICFLSCERNSKPSYYSSLDKHTNRSQEGILKNGMNVGLWIYYSDNVYQIDSVSFYKDDGELQWTKKFYDGYPVIMTIYDYKIVKRLIINKFGYERMNGLRSYIYPSYLAGKNIYNINCASCHYGNLQLNADDTLNLKKMFNRYTTDISDTMDIITLSKDNHFKLHYTNEIDRESLLIFLSKLGTISDR